jgi:hypothetical protein
LKNKKTTWHAGNGWTRTTTSKGSYFFHKGKKVSEKRFDSSLERRKIRRIKPEGNWRRLPQWRRIEIANEKPPSSKGSKQEKLKGQFCRLKNREEFFKKVLEDRKEFAKKAGEEKSSAVQLWFQIGDGRKMRLRSDKWIQYTHGLRKFVDLRKARLFLGIDGVMTSGDRPLPRWTKRGKNSVCQFEKKAFLVLPNKRQGRKRAPRILKKYIIQE